MYAIIICSPSTRHQWTCWCFLFLWTNSGPLEPSKTDLVPMFVLQRHVHTRASFEESWSRSRRHLQLFPPTAFPRTGDCGFPNFFYRRASSSLTRSLKRSSYDTVWTIDQHPCFTEFALCQYYDAVTHLDKKINVLLFDRSSHSIFWTG